MDLILMLMKVEVVQVFQNAFACRDALGYLQIAPQVVQVVTAVLFLTWVFFLMCQALMVVYSV
jgi:hypothetical protein